MQFSQIFIYCILFCASQQFPIPDHVTVEDDGLHVGPHFGLVGKAAVGRAYGHILHKIDLVRLYSGHQNLTLTMSHLFYKAEKKLLHAGMTRFFIYAF